MEKVASTGKMAALVQVDRLHLFDAGTEQRIAG